MIRRIFKSILGSCLVVLVLCLAGILSILYVSFSNTQTRELNVEADLVASVLNWQPEADPGSFSLDGSRISIISPEGQVLYDSSGEAESGSHLDREEVQQALTTGMGSASRYSDTLRERTVYAARLLDNGNVLRLSASYWSVLGLLMQVFWPLVLLVIAAVVIALSMARSLASSIVKPINAIDPEYPLLTQTYPQLQPLLVKLDEYQKDNQKQMAQLKEKSMEFETVVSSMSEGMVLVSRHDRVLSANAAARSLFDLKKEAVLTDDLLLSMVKEARRSGRVSRSISLTGRELLLEACRIDPDVQDSRVILLMMDVTEKVLAAKRRQEFTANVTHELKTPLQTILSSAELLESGMVKAEDQPRFLGYIAREARHMGDMVNDILHLSRLDSGLQEDKEWISLPDAVSQILDRNHKRISEMDLSVKSDVASVSVYCDGRAVEDILSNLISNAVKYNREHGSIDIRVSAVGAELSIVVSDTGIGIAPKDQSRIFERFFRADKSHSRSVQGTGLGLSIVKHRVDQLKGKVWVTSVPEKGTSFTVQIPIEKAWPVSD